MKPPKLTPYVILGVLFVVPIIASAWVILTALVFHRPQSLLPDREHMTHAQYTTHVLVIYTFLIAIPGCITLTLLGAFDYFRARRDPEIEADYQRRRAAAETANS